MLHQNIFHSFIGASDDGISCAVMLELIRALSVLPKRLKHNVLFLFNGAEETPLEVNIFSITFFSLSRYFYIRLFFFNKLRVLICICNTDGLTNPV